MLLENKITPIVTLYHWDLPQVRADLTLSFLFLSADWTLQHEHWCGFTLHLFRCCRRNMAAGRTSAWWTTSMTLPTCASRDSGTEWSTGSPSTTPGWVGARRKKRCIHRSLVTVCCVDQTVLCLIFQSIAVEGYETGEHAPGLKLRGTGAYKAAHHIIKVRLETFKFVFYCHQTTDNRPQLLFCCRHFDMK